jgi:hypothetical protein
MSPEPSQSRRKASRLLGQNRLVSFNQRSQLSDKLFGDQGLQMDDHVWKFRTSTRTSLLRMFVFFLVTSNPVSGDLQTPEHGDLHQVQEGSKGGGGGEHAGNQPR